MPHIQGLPVKMSIAVGLNLVSDPLIKHWNYNGDYLAIWVQQPIFACIWLFSSLVKLFYLNWTNLINVWFIVIIVTCCISDSSLQSMVFYNSSTWHLIGNEGLINNIPHIYSRFTCKNINNCKANSCLWPLEQWNYNRDRLTIWFQQPSSICMILQGFLGDFIIFLSKRLWWESSRLPSMQEIIYDSTRIIVLFFVQFFLVI